MAAIVANCAISLNCELTQPVKVQYIDGNMFSMDNAGNTAHVYVFYNGEPQEIVGSVTADVIRSDGTTVAITGAMSGNRAYVIFPQSCYAVPGVVSVVIKVTEGSTVTTIAAFVANVYRSSTDTIVDPGTIIPSVQNLISAIETAVASIPADYSSLWESLAPDYTNITFPVTAGKYCTYNGTLYIAKVDIATTESFTAAHWQSTNIGDNLSALKSAIKSSVYGTTVSATFERGDLDNGDGSTTSSTARARITDYVTYVDTCAIVNPNASDTVIRLFFYKTDGTFISASPWNDNPTVFLSNLAPANTGKFKIVARMADNSYIDNDELATIQQTVIANNTGIPGGALPYKYPITMTDDQKSIALNNVGAIKTTRNLWPHGDQTEIDQYRQKDISLPAGTYVISAEITSTKNGAEAPNYNARLELRSGSTSVQTVTLTRYGRASVIVTLPSAIDNVRLFASNTSANSSGATGNWRNIQIESGKWLTPYIDHKVTGDVQPSHITNDELLCVENVTIDGYESSNREWDFIFCRQHKDTRNVVIDVEAKYTGTNANNAFVAPKIRAFYSTGDQGTCYYGIGGKGQYRHTMYRLPPFPDYTGTYENYMRLQLIVPAGFSLTIKSMRVRYDDVMCRPMDSGLQIDTHCAFMFYPEHTYPAANAAQRCGATRLITIPKCSSDGVWFAYHDDTFDISSTVLRNADGTTISDTTYNNMAFSSIPWSYLKDLTVSKSNSYGAFPDTRLMRIDDFFKLCGRTGAKPMFSLHPVLTSEEYQSLYDLAKKYGVLSNLTLKPASADTAFPRLVSVFGEDVESYGLITTRNHATDSDVQALITALGNSGLDGTKVKMYIELWADLATPTQVAAILAAGYAASLAGYPHTDVDGTTGTLFFSEADYNYWTGIGVTEFTENHNPSLGLDW